MNREKILEPGIRDVDDMSLDRRTRPKRLYLFADSLVRE